MSKKVNPKILSPANYIRQRARNLPLYKCFINEEWEDVGMSEIIISRKYINSKVTLCLYLVDKDCLGIKDSFHHFYIPEYKMHEMIDNIDHNLIFKNRKEIAPIKYFKSTSLKLNHFTSKTDLAGIENLSLYMASRFSDWEDEDQHIVLPLIELSRLSALREYLLKYSLENQ